MLTKVMMKLTVLRCVQGVLVALLGDVPSEWQPAWCDVVAAAAAA